MGGCWNEEEDFEEDESDRRGGQGWPFNGWARTRTMTMTMQGVDKDGLQVCGRGRGAGRVLRCGGGDGMGFAEQGAVGGGQIARLIGERGPGEGGGPGEGEGIGGEDADCLERLAERPVGDAGGASEGVEEGGSAIGGGRRFSRWRSENRWRTRGGRGVVGVRGWSVLLAPFPGGVLCSTVSVGVRP